MNGPSGGGRSADVFIPESIISGGQTGVDRGALEFAIATGIDHGGWCPAGRIAEDGVIPRRYKLLEMDTKSYPARTAKNVIDSDATLILHEGFLGRGTALTVSICRREHRPHLNIDMSDASFAAIREWFNATAPLRLNVAGPREGTCPGIQRRTEWFLDSLFAEARDESR